MGRLCYPAAPADGPYRCASDIGRPAHLRVAEVLARDGRGRGGALRDLGARRLGRDGRGLSRARSRTRARGRAQAALRHDERGALRARGARARRSAPPRHRRVRRPRHAPSAGRSFWPWSGSRARTCARTSPRWARLSRRTTRFAIVRGAAEALARGARARHRPPRHQPPEPVPRRRRHPRRQGSRLRHRAAAASHLRHDAARRLPRHARATWRPSRLAATRRSTPAPTCSRWGACCTSASPVAPRSRPTTSWRCSARSSSRTRLACGSEGRSPRCSTTWSIGCSPRTSRDGRPTRPPCWRSWTRSRARCRRWRRKWSPRPRCRGRSRTPSSGWSAW